MTAARIRVGDRVYFRADAWMVARAGASMLVLVREGDAAVKVASLYAVALAPPKVEEAVEDRETTQQAAAAFLDRG